jgi:uncharacterized protein YkwD
LTVTAQLTKAAQAREDDMAAQEYFSHVSPQGIRAWSFIQAQCYGYRSAGENLAINFTDSETLVAAWMNSPGHRSNLLNPQFTEIGVGIAAGEFKGHKTLYVVQLFARPLTQVK